MVIVAQSPLAVIVGEEVPLEAMSSMALHQSAISGLREAATEFECDGFDNMLRYYSQGYHDTN
uniref:Uncharacterized protein n=1 Tax=Leersia perrieri TaxID=77586 RepID=A0A0D9X0M2_9ORYZ